MSAVGTAAIAEADLLARVEALEDAADAVAAVGPSPAVEAARDTAAEVRRRLALGLDVTLVGIAGPTGVGKSSLFNALVGADLAPVTVFRPTTDEPLACVFGDAGERALDWLGVRQRHRRTPPVGWDGLVLIDLPDMDTVKTWHRAIVDRIVARLDLVLWVVDVEKYADQVVHEEYLRPLASRGRAMRLLLSRMDLLRPKDWLAVSGDLARRLEEYGLVNLHPVPVSVRANQGMDDVRAALDDALREPSSVLSSLAGEVALAARGLSPSERAVELPRDGVEEVQNALYRGVRLDVAQERVRSDAEGLVRRLTAAPWAVASTRSPPEAPLVSSAGVGEVQRALDLLGEDVAAGLDPPWSSAARRRIADTAEPIRERGTRRIEQAGQTAAAEVAAPVGLRRAWRGAVGLALVGLVWLVAGGIVTAAGFVDATAVAIVVPAVLLAIGAVGTLLVLGARRSAARRAGERAIERFSDQAHGAVQRELLLVAEAWEADREELRRLIGQATRDGGRSTAARGERDDRTTP